MKFIIKKDRENLLNLARKIGYYFQGQKKDELSFVRPLERIGYPRFHLYAKENNKELAFNLHLDQKRPSYGGASAHSGEYEGAVVEKEMERIKQILK